MPESNHIVYVRYHKNGFFMTRAVHQYDYGQILEISDFPNLPNSFEMHFATKGDTRSVTQIGVDGQVTIPDVLLTKNANVICWLYLHDGNNDGETRYVIEIPVISRAEITDEEPTPEEQSAIEEIIVALNAAVDKCEAAADEIKNMSVTTEDLPEGSSSTSSYSDGLLTIGIPAGRTGEKGDKGDKGDTGEQGPKGDKGDKGDRGEKGDKGDKGNTGERGPQGLVGPKGDRGEKGDKGDKGDTGEQGPKGEKGDTGESGIPVIDDNAGVGYTDKTWSANKISNEFNKVAVIPGTGAGSAKTKNFAYRDGNVTVNVSQVASGIASFAEGYATFATAMASHAEGENASARGRDSHAEGLGTRADSSAQHVQGKYNIVDGSGQYADILGNGTDNDHRSNAYTLDWNGNGWFAGKVSASRSPEANNDLTTKEYVDTCLENVTAGKVDGAYVEDGVAYFTSGDDVLFSITGIGGGGGGGGSGNNAILTVQNTTGWISRTVSSGSDVILSLTWSSLENGTPTGNGVLYISNNESAIRSMEVQQGEVSLNAKDFISSGSNTVRLRIDDIYGNSKNIVFSINTVELILTSTFNNDAVYSSAFAFPYTAMGDIEKTVYLEIDDNVVDTQTISVSGRQRTFNVSPLTHGDHVIRCWFTSVINGETVSSNVLEYDIVYASPSGTSTIISSNFSITTASQYSFVPIDYIVYKPNILTAPVTISLNNEVVSTQIVDRTRHIYNARLDTAGTNTITISSDGTVKTFIVTVTAIDMAEAETDNLVLHLTSYGRSNTESPASRINWQDSDNNISATLTGFNFTSDGWIIDEDGNDVLRVSGDARVTIPYQMFANDFRTTGKTIEVEFATRSVMDYDATIFSCVSEGVGLTLTSQSATLNSEQSSIVTRYKENEHVRISFVCEKRSENRLLMVYINGIPSGVMQYPSDDDFSQRIPVGISIGSSQCAIDIYCIRVYDNNLTRHQILNNLIADTRDINEMIDLYNRNNVYDAYGNIVISRLPSNLPYMIVEAAELPQYKGDKKTVSGTYIDPENPAKSFTFTGCQINVQGTSSAPYARKNYDLQFKNGFEMTASGEHADNYALVDTIVPFNRFVTKADVASSEGANNVELVKLYCDISPYKTREMIADSRVRQGIYGFPIVMFWRNTTTGTTSFLGKYNFNLPKRAPAPYGYSGDMESWEFQNNTSNLMLFKSDYFDETMYTDPETGDTKERWRYDYEARFPNDTWVNYAKLQELQSFVVSTDRSAATGDNLATPVSYNGLVYTKDTADYRLAKFKAEFGNYAEVSSFIFYYLFTEFFLMVDSRAKNLFIGFSGSDTDPELNLTIDRKAVAEPYDMDTAIGTNNEGSLVFGFSLEDTDHLAGGANVFNGQNSVLWENVRDAFSVEIQQMYQTLRSNGILSYNVIEGRYEEHQSVWPEAIWIEDSWFKYIDPLIAPDSGKEPTAVYLPMMQGSKEEQRKWWLYNRFRYMDSKWNAGDALIDVIQLRGYAKANITVTPYADIYPTVKYASYIVQERGQHGVPTTLVCPIDEMTDTEIYIYSASQIAAIGDLSPLKVGFADFSKATRLQTIKVGDESASYENLNMTELTLGTNALLRTLDARNCSALGTGSQKTVDLSNCINIEHIYLGGTSIAGVSLPNGGTLKTLQLPNTITSLILRNQTALTSFQLAGTSNLTTLWIENTSNVVDMVSLIEGMPSGSRVRAIGLNMEASTPSQIDELYDILDTMRGLDETGANVNKAQVSGSITVPFISEDQLSDFTTRYSSVSISYDRLTFDLIYMDDTGTTVLHRDSFDSAGDGYWGSIPSKESTPQYSYQFTGWSRTIGGNPDATATTNVTETRTIYATYRSILRSYTIRFMSGSTVLQSNTLDYGTMPNYTGSTPTNTDAQFPEDYEFSGWNPEIRAVDSNLDYVAEFNYIGAKSRKYIQNTLTSIDDSSITEVGNYAFYSKNIQTIILQSAISIGTNAFSNNASLTTVSLPSATSIGNSAFFYCTNLTTVSLPSAITIDDGAFNTCSSLTSISIPDVTSLGTSAFASCTSLATVSFPNVISLSGTAFFNCTNLTTVSLPSLVTIGNSAFSNCTNLATIYIPMVESIGDSAFITCSSLTSISLPSLITSNSNMFRFCSSLTDIYVSFDSNSSLARNAPWGAPNATVHYNTMFDENGNPIV